MMNMGNNCGDSAFLREFYFTAIGFFIIYFYDFLQTNIDFIRMDIKLMFLLYIILFNLLVLSFEQ